MKRHSRRVGVLFLVNSSTCEEVREPLEELGRDARRVRAQQRDLRENAHSLTKVSGKQ